MLKAFADAGSRSLMVETASDDAVTAIRIGNAGIVAGAADAGGELRRGRPPIRNSARNATRQGG